MVTPLHTQNGPRCEGCGGTSWSYLFVYYGSAMCGGCDFSEGPLRIPDGDVLPLPRTEDEVLALHRGFREATVRAST